MTILVDKKYPLFIAVGDDSLLENFDAGNRYTLEEVTSVGISEIELNDYKFSLLSAEIEKGEETHTVHYPVTAKNNEGKTLSEEEMFTLIEEYIDQGGQEF